MAGSLSDEDVTRFREDGFLTAVDCLSEAEAADFLARLEAIEQAEIEARGGVWEDRDYRPWDHPTHPMKDWLHEIAHHPKLLDVVESVIGPDILVRNCDVFIKNAGVRRGIGAHRDTAVLGDLTAGLITVWLGLTESTVENGGMYFYRHSHRADLPDAPKDRFTLTLTNTARAALDPADKVDNIMRPGQLSMHHFTTVHGSGPNRTAGRRVAFVGRFMAPDVTQEIAECGQAVLVRGTDRTGNFHLVDDFAMTWTMP